MSNLLNDDKVAWMAKSLSVNVSGYRGDKIIAYGIIKKSN